MAKKRNSWPDFFMELAETYAKRSTCPRAHVGCVIVNSNRQIGAGFNGAPSGLAHCDELLEGCTVNGHCNRSIHAEVNAVLQACKLAPNLVEGSVAYVTHSPCLRCASILRQAGVRMVVYKKRYGDGLMHTALTSDDKFLIFGFKEWKSLLIDIKAKPWTTQN